MDPKLLTEEGWKAVALKAKIKDNSLQRALSVYEKLPDDKQADRLKAIATLGQIATALKKAKEVVAAPDVLKYLTNLLAALQSEQREITKAQEQAEKEAKSATKASADAKKREQEEQQAGQAGDDKKKEEEEEETGDSLEKLKRTLQSLKASKVPYHFIACDAKPYGLVVSKKNIKSSSQHKKELAAIAGGSTRPPKFGTCRREGNNLIFDMEQPAPGLARILQKWLKNCAGIPLKVTVGTESAEDDDGQPGGEDQKQKSAVAETPSAPPTQKEMEVLEDRRRDFKKARAAWVAAKTKAESDLEKVKDGARMIYLADAKQFPKVVQGCKDIDAILDNLDDELRDTLDQYASTSLKNQGRLHALAATAAEIVDRYHSYVEGNQIMKAIDKKEFADVTIHAPIMKALENLRKSLS